MNFDCIAKYLPVLCLRFFGYIKYRDRKEHKILGSRSVIRIRFCLGSEYSLKIRFTFGSTSVHVLFGSGSSSRELERCLRGGHLLQINCNCKYQSQFS